MGDDSDNLPENEGEKRSALIQSVSIAARFLNLLARSDSALALGELAKRAGTGRSTAHRYMQSLVREGLVVQDPASGSYDLGPAALGIGISALRRINPVETAGRQMNALASRIGASCGVAIWTERGPTVVRWARSASFSISTVALGDVLPLDNSACGLVFQAYLPPDRIAAVRRLQPAAFRGSRPDAGILETIREAGGAELNEHLFSALTGKAAPVFDAQGELCCVVTTVSFVATAETERHFSRLIEAARQATAESGGA
ncbi:IclR family transcriptional regulator [Agrobacterium sp. LMR679]|uniref:IclR family transcriptional regulator n=1 Tax=Agrobacterium sp. LMR679 TaxID=3014335 RepID=UPI0022B03472|nr:IclR family transcriptional regulator [Agrobacterium sp. LMR679]MCZ4071787.1 IclR family transcriptional regulator [Agrobacterium sp. LMR679]